MREIKELSNILKKYKLAFTDYDLEEIEYLIEEIIRKYNETEDNFKVLKELNRNDRIGNYVTTRYASELAGVHINTIRNWIKEGKLETKFLGWQHVIELDELNDFLGGIDK